MPSDNWLFLYCSRGILRALALHTIFLRGMYVQMKSRYYYWWDIGDWSSYSRIISKRGHACHRIVASRSAEKGKEALSIIRKWSPKSIFIKIDASI